MIRHRNPDPVRPDRVVILGASGFVAKDLARHLRESGVEAVAVGSGQVDLRDPAASARLGGIVRQTDSLVFVSALTPDRGRDIKTLMANLAMAENVCGFLEKSPCAHVVYVSSDAVYADDADPVRETSCCDPSGYHGLMHLARERMLLETLRAGATPLLRLRASLLFGAGDTHNGYGPNRFVRTALAEKRVALFGGGEEQRDHVYIKDLSRLTGLALAYRSEGVLNVATGESVSFHDVARAVAERAGGGVSVEPSPRQNPISHRRFDVAETRRAFPDFPFTPMGKALDETFADARSGA